MSTGGTESVKGQVVDKGMDSAHFRGGIQLTSCSAVPKRFKNLKFGINSNQGIVNQAVLEVSDRMLYDVEKMRRPVPHGALDSRLVGLSESSYTGVLFG